jgi:hypothetical protein
VLQGEAIIVVITTIEYARIVVFVPPQDPALPQAECEYTDHNHQPYRPAKNSYPDTRCRWFRIGNSRRMNELQSLAAGLVKRTPAARLSLPRHEINSRLTEILGNANLFRRTAQAERQQSTKGQKPWIRGEGRP